MKTDELIKNLSATLRQSEKSLLAASSLLTWFVASTGLLFVILFLLPFRADLALQFKGTYFRIETLLCLAGFLMAVFIAYRSSIPNLLGEKEETVGRLLLIIMGGALMSKILILGLHPDLSLKDQFLAEMDFYRGRCGPIMLMIGITGSGVLMALARRAAPTRPMKTGAWIALAAGSMALLAMQFICWHDAFLHTIIWHFIPVVLLAFTGAALAKQVLKW